MMDGSQEAFLDLLIAAMMDAAENGALTQLKTVLDPKQDGKFKTIRIIVVPEAMAVEAPPGHVFTTKPNGS
jgi:hypothetical protein